MSVSIVEKSGCFMRRQNWPEDTNIGAVVLVIVAAVGGGDDDNDYNSQAYTFSFLF